MAPVHLSPLEYRIYDIVRKSKYGIPGPRLIDRVYADREDGGPDTAATSVYVTIKKANRKLKPAGIKIAGTTPGRGAVYKIMPA